MVYLIRNKLFVMCLDQMFQNFLPSEDYFKQGLYTFDMGQNDLDGAFYAISEDQVISLVPNVLAEFESGIKVNMLMLV